MNEPIAGLAAAAVAVILNRLLVATFGVPAVVWLSPAGEEAAKTLLAVAFGASIINVHLVFGIIEAVYDLFTGAKNGVTAGLFGMAGHTLFGAITAAVYSGSGTIIAGLAAGTFAHIAWNLFVVGKLARVRSSKGE